mmetsp:Transcript_70588/g.159694  ORF Transcript_70588/g.159694 Transcript_70588/m.159694 type:complete len:210 (+) Transcript_70588:394-1023(+)
MAPPDWARTVRAFSSLPPEDRSRSTTLPSSPAHRTTEGSSGWETRDRTAQPGEWAWSRARAWVPFRKSHSTTPPSSVPVTQRHGSPRVPMAASAVGAAPRLPVSSTAFVPGADRSQSRRPSSPAVRSVCPPSLCQPSAVAPSASTRRALSGGGAWLAKREATAWTHSSPPSRSKATLVPSPEAATPQAGDTPFPSAFAAQAPVASSKKP